MVARDDEGGFLMGRTLVAQGLMEVDEGEAWGVVEAMCWAKDLEFDRVIIETDSKRVYDSILALSHMDSIFGDLICHGMEFLKNRSIFL
ncbi:hypothetical protein ACS0TY_024225 [Phlomoides rotata]